MRDSENGYSLCLGEAAALKAACRHAVALGPKRSWGEVATPTSARPYEFSFHKPKPSFSVLLVHSP